MKRLLALALVVGAFAAPAAHAGHGQQAYADSLCDMLRMSYSGWHQDPSSGVWIKDVFAHCAPAGFDKSGPYWTYWVWYTEQARGHLKLFFRTRIDPSGGAMDQPVALAPAQWRRFKPPATRFVAGVKIVLGDIRAYGPDGTVPRPGVATGP